MIWILAAVCAAAAAYQLVAIASCVAHLMRRRPQLRQPAPVVSILKPVHRVTPDLAAAVESHAGQQYPDFETLLGVREAAPNLPGARVVECHTVAPNAKVGSLIDLGREAQGSVLIVNDADIVVPRDYIRDVIAELQAPGVGLVTCIYRARASTFPGVWEGLGVATDFAPGTLVAPFVGVSEFGLGATLAFHRRDLDAIGGFAAVADYLADDYQLGAKLHALGRRNVIARPVVSTSLDAPSWSDVWRHQLRWGRTIRLSRTGGYAGLPLTFATLWALVAGVFGYVWLAIPLIALRLVMAVVAGHIVLRDRNVLKYLYLVPFRDLYGVAVWAASLFGSTVEWGGGRLMLDSSGRIVSGERAS